MRIAIDAHAIGSKLTGNERYIENLAEHLLAVGGENEFFFFFTEEQALRRWEGRMPHLRAGLVSRNPYWRLGVDFSYKLTRLRPQVFHYQYTGPAITSCAEVVTIHDVSFEEHPEFFSRGERLRLRLTVRRSVRSARRIITVSEFSKAEIIRLFKIPDEKIRVIPNGVGPEFMAIKNQQTIDHQLRRYGLQRPYFLVVGNLCRRKNQQAALRGFARWLRRSKGCKHRLVMAGKGKAYAEGLRSEATRCGLEHDRVLLPGFVPDEDLGCLYSGAEALINVSLYEGFGLPLVEAMRCGLPVIASRASCFPEIAEDAARYVNPTDPDDIAEAMDEVTAHGTTRHELIRAGLRRAELFRWDAAARKTLEVYQEAADGFG